MLAATLAATCTALAACQSTPPRSTDTATSATTGERLPRPPYRFNAKDEAFLNDVQRGAFQFLWNAGNANTGMVPDRLSNPAVVSIAGVGFQLSALPIGVERGWVTREQAAVRAMKILASLDKDPAICKAGFFQHFLDADTAGLHKDTLEHVVSTIDSALLFCGMLTASSYFGGDVAQKADSMFAQANFRFFVSGDEEKQAWQRGFVSLGWKPDSLKDASGKGHILPYYWIDSGCEHRLVSLLGVCAPREEFRLEPAAYYKLRRTLGTIEGDQTVVWFPYSGALFVNQFSHCWVNYAAMGPDDPTQFGFATHLRAPIDWWENSRRMTRLHQLKAMEFAAKYKTFGENAWGLSASDCPNGYCVPGVFPTPVPMPGATPKVDFAPEHPRDDAGDGTLAPYAMGTSIMFDPTRSVAGLRHMASIPGKDGKPAIWHDPASGGYGFADAINLDKDWASKDFVAIDQGPMLLAIENARTGLIWKLFHKHPTVQAGLERLQIRPAGK
jgi:hypothetical protein